MHIFDRVAVHPSVIRREKPEKERERIRREILLLTSPHRMPLNVQMTNPQRKVA